jgi:hypothetical protein
MRKKKIVLIRHEIKSDVSVEIRTSYEKGVVVHCQTKGGKVMRLNFTSNEALDMGLINLEVLQPYFKNL